MPGENWALMPWVDSYYCRPCFRATNQWQRLVSFIIPFVSRYEMIIQNICIFKLKPFLLFPADRPKKKKQTFILGQKAFIGLINVKDVNRIGVKTDELISGQCESRTNVLNTNFSITAEKNCLINGSGTVGCDLTALFLSFFFFG